MSHKHETIVKPFSDVHNKGGKILATLLHDPTIEGLDVALYMDGSASMEDEYGPRGVLAKLGGVRNQVEPQMRWMLEYLATKDKDGVLRVAYWATGDGSEIEVVGDLSGTEAKEYKFPGPKFYGKGTVMLPVLRDYVAHIRTQAEKGAKRGLAVIITDSQIYDPDDIKAYSAQVAKRSPAVVCPNSTSCLWESASRSTKSKWKKSVTKNIPDSVTSGATASPKKMEEMAELVAVLVDEAMTVASGGVIYDDKNNVVKRYESRLPAVLEFTVPAGCTELHAGSKRTEVYAAYSRRRSSRGRR